MINLTTLRLRTSIHYDIKKKMKPQSKGRHLQHIKLKEVIFGLFNDPCYQFLKKNSVEKCAKDLNGTFSSKKENQNVNNYMKTSSTLWKLKSK